MEGESLLFMNWTVDLRVELFSVRSEITFWTWAVAREPMVNHLPEWVRRVTHHFLCTSSWRDVRQSWSGNCTATVAVSLISSAELQKHIRFGSSVISLDLCLEQVPFLSLCHLWLLGTENKPFFSFCCQVINWCSGEDGGKKLCLALKSTRCAFLNWGEELIKMR